MLGCYGDWRSQTTFKKRPLLTLLIGFVVIKDQISKKILSVIDFG
jgi:hypothetical protein